MKSRISFFNPTVYKKNFSMYWPILVCYLIYGLIKVPGQIWLRLQQSQPNLTDILRDQAVGESLSLKADIAAIAVMTILCGMALFSYLFTAKASYAMHALPVTRTELFITNVLSGLTFFFVPQVLVFLATMVLCLTKGIVCVQFLALWLVSVMGISFFSFSTVCLCAMLTGQLFALPVYFVVFQYAAMALSYGCRYVESYLGYGISLANLSDPTLFRILSPLHYIKNNVRIRVIAQYDSWYQITGIKITYQGGEVLIAYVLAALVCYLLAFYGYRKRSIESAGDLLTFHWLRPLFRWCVGLGSGYLLGVFLLDFLNSVSIQVTKPFMFLTVAAFAAIGFFVAQMFVEKGFRVFCKRTFGECFIFLLFTMASFGVFTVIANGMEQYVPNQEDVERAYVSYNYPAEYTGDEIAKAIQIQKEILAQADSYRSSNSENSDYVEFTYLLKNGKKCVRSYQIPLDDENAAELSQQILSQEETPDNFLYYLIGSDYAEISDFTSGTVEMTISDTEYQDLEMDAETAKVLYEAMKKDIEAGTLQKYSLTNALYSFGSEQNPDLASANLILQFTHADKNWKDVYSRSTDIQFEIYGDEQNFQMADEASIYVSFGADCTNIIQALVDTGVIASEEDLIYTAAGYYN